MKDDLSRSMATYRLQFNHDFGFAEAQALVPYFSRLGITHLYASPILRARQSSTHGYDVVDPATINPNLGDKTELISLDGTLSNYGLGLVLDIVPNHMAASIENPYWRDVLTYGPSSPFASWFDIDWRMPDPDMWGRVLVPVLGERRAQILKKDQLQLAWSDGRFLVQYFDHIFPVDPATVPSICEFGLDDLKQKLEPGHPVLEQIDEILAYLESLPKSATRLRRQVHIDREETERQLANFAHIVVKSPTLQQWAEETAQRFGEGETGRERFRKLLDAQPYRLVHWRDAARAINYRRFFDINELVSVRQEDPQVFQDTHAEVLRWVEEGLIDGLRIDHIDGLRDPLGYLERLAEALNEIESQDRSVPVFVEKILAAQEKLPHGWPVSGTTGYEFLNQVEAVFLSRKGFEEIEENYCKFLRKPATFSQTAEWGKRRILRNDLSPQVGRLADLLERMWQESRATAHAMMDDPQAADAQALPDAQDPLAPNPETPDTPAIVAGQRDLKKRDFVDALVEVMIALPVYRTYIDRNHAIISDADRQYLETAIETARQRDGIVPEALDFLAEVLLLKNRVEWREHEIHERVNFIERFQQLTGPAAAKGIEDTALYAYVPLVSLNEVGGEPHLCPGDPVTRLHEANEDRSTTWPRHMLCVTTHDTKRTADVRARLDVLSEMPKRWFRRVRKWRKLNKPLRTSAKGKVTPDAATEYLIYQTIVGIWPASGALSSSELPPPEVRQELHERLETYVIKAIREAKTRTSWTNQNAEYEDGVKAFLNGLFQSDEEHARTFLGEVQELVARIARPGFWNSLSRTLIQLTAPGTPDIYQGDELWNFALVDPDNRRPVDYEKRQQMLDDVITHIEGPEDSRRSFLQSLVEAPEDGRIKLHIVHTALAMRYDHTSLFATGHYIPLQIEGPNHEHLIAYARVARASENSEGTQKAAIIVVPRLTTSLKSAAPVGEAVWSETRIRLPETLQNREWRSALLSENLSPQPGEFLKASAVLGQFPVALLVSS